MKGAGVVKKKDFHLLRLQYVAGSEVRTLHSRDQQHRSNEAILLECDARFLICTHPLQSYLLAPQTIPTLVFFLLLLFSFLLCILFSYEDGQ